MDRDPTEFNFSVTGKTEYEKLSEISGETLLGLHEAFAVHLLERGRTEPYVLDAVPGYMSPRSLSLPIDPVMAREFFYKDQLDVTVMPDCSVSYESPHFMDAISDRRVISTTLVSLKIAIGMSGVLEQRCYHFIQDHSEGTLSAEIDVSFTSQQGGRVDVVVNPALDEEERTLDFLTQQASMFRQFTQTDVDDLARLLQALSDETVERVV